MGVERSLEAAAARLAELLTGRVAALSDPAGRDLDFEADVTLRPLERAARRRPTCGPSTAARRWWPTPAACRCSSPGRRGSASATARACSRRRATLRAAPARRRRRARRRAGRARRRRHRPPTLRSTSTSLRDRWEWDAVARSVDECEPGGVVLVDGDLAARLAHPVVVPRASCSTAAAERERRASPASPSTRRSPAAARRCSGWLEREADALLGDRGRCGGHRSAARAADVGGAAGRRRPARPRCPLRLPRRPARRRSTPRRALGALSRAVRRRRLPRLPLSAVGRRPAGRLPGLAAPASVRIQLDELLRPRRRARSTCASAPSPTATA